jgi:hypothetical protein
LASSPERWRVQLQQPNQVAECAGIRELASSPERWRVQLQLARSGTGMPLYII